MNEKRWYQLKDVEDLSAQEKILLTREYVNPGMAELFALLGFDWPWGASAEDMHITLKDGRRILDMTGGNGVLGLGHNHPRILAARSQIAEKRCLEFCKSFLSPYMAALAANMASLLPGDLQYSFFCNSGAEAVEGALKLAEKHHGRERLGIVYTDSSFHGKTHAAMSVSNLDDSRKNFKLLTDCYQVPYGDASALEELFRSHSKPGTAKTDLCAFIVEAIHGTRIIFPPAGYLQRVRELCSQYDVLLILDEIYTGFGHTGYWFAFQSEGIIPDIVCYSKAFGGGKATIAGYTARKSVFLQAYGKTDEALMHSSTFSGMSEECATAIETLNILKEEGLVEKARGLGDYFGGELNKLKAKYPQRVAGVRGRGLLWGLELKAPLEEAVHLIAGILGGNPEFSSTLAGAMFMAELFHTHNLLVYLGFTRRNLVVFSPALIVKKEELDQAIRALDSVLSTNWLKLCSSFAARKIFAKSDEA